MAKRKKIVNGGEAAASLKSAPGQSTAPSEIRSELPAIESPPISPGSETPATSSIETAAATEPEASPDMAAPGAPGSSAAARFQFKLNARRRRNAMLAASVVFAAGLGAVIGAAGSSRFASTPPADVAGLQERKAMEQSIAQLSEELSTLKANIATVSKASQSQIAKISAKISDKITEHFDQAKNPEATGSIPTPRPAPGVPAAEAPPARPPVVKDWAIRDARGGLVYVQGHGDIYQVTPGAPLPGLGPVQSIKRQDGRWVVTTPKGIIVSMRDRRYFE